MTGTPTLLAPVKAHSVDPNKAIRIQRAHDYPIQIWIFLTCFLGILTFCHIGVLFVFWQRKKRARACSLVRLAPEKSATEGTSPVWVANRRISLRRIPLAVLNWFRIVTCRITIPVGGGSVLNGAEIGITAGYIAALFTWEFINSMNVETGAKFEVSYWANRAACIVRSQLPLLVALAGKNNIVSLLTGISYEKLNILHRSAARVCLILIWVHFWGRVKQGLTDTLSLSMPWVRAGIMTATAYTLLVLISFRPLRTRFYEFFFFSHFILVLMILIGSYFHMRHGFGAHSFVEVGPYSIPAFALWALDRSLRLIRVLLNSRTNNVASKSGALDATVELLSPTMVRVVLTRKMTWRAGQSAFLIMPGVSHIPFEAHPFTIASIPERGALSNTSSSDFSEGDDRNREEEARGNKLLFLIRVRTGFTRRLREAAKAQGTPGCTFPLSVYVDGPYGSPPDLNAFQNVILIAGGSGVTYTLPRLQQLVHDASDGNAICRNVSFLWVVAHRSNLAWISDAIHNTLGAAPQALKIRFRMYVTQEAPSQSDLSSRSTTPDDNKHPETVTQRLLRDNRVSVEVGRPNIQAVLERELLKVEGHVSVDVAGPAGLAADVRKALRSGVAGPMSVLKGGPDITLHVETYGIAASNCCPVVKQTLTPQLQ